MSVVSTLLLSVALSAQPWSDVALSPDARASLVEARMTVDEKIAMVSGTFGTRLRTLDPAEKRLGAGHVPGVPRLGIPDLYETDAGLGVANGGAFRPGDVATAMPSGLAIAASFDPALAYAGGATMGAEARAKGFNVMLAGGANLVRDPWGGRSFEYFGEDVLLTGTMAGESIRGVQSNGIISTVKHFALNAQETGRYVLDARLSEAPLRESDLLAFQLTIQRGRPGAVMCGYNKVNADWNCENRFLLTDVLKHDWAFPGWVMSDWGAVHSTAKAANAGLDQQSGQELDQHPFFAGPLKAAVAAGTVPQERLDDMVHRILRTMFAHGLVDRPAPSIPEPIDYKAHGDVAQTAAAEGIVLLRNERGLLPLSGREKRIVVIGAHADIGVISGGGSSQVMSASGNPIHVRLASKNPELRWIKLSYHGSAPLAALRARAPGSDITYVDSADPAEAVAIARTADVVLVFAEQWRTEAVDIPSLSLPDGQDALIAAVAAANPHTVVVLETGGAVLMPWLDKVAGVLEAWYPGERGGEAISSVLFGDVDASGRLPVTFPASATQAPRPETPGLAEVRNAQATTSANRPGVGMPGFDIGGGVPTFPVDYREGADVGHRWYERNGTTPLFPFGYGLSYGRFTYSGLDVREEGGLHVRFTVTNISRRVATDVPQVYARTDDAAATRRLVGFQRLTLAPGESRTVDVRVDTRVLRSYRPSQHGWAPLSGRLAIGVGHDLDHVDLHQDVAVGG